jgi:hypothetical protein
MLVAHVNGHCEGIYASIKLWLFSHALILPKKTSLHIVEHGMDLSVEGWLPCLQTINIFQMMGTFSMMVIMSLLKVKKG